MGREVKRVPLDFDWPVGEVWPGNCVGWCGIMKDDCDKCKLFAMLAGILGEYGCPDIPALEIPKGDGYQIWETVSEGSPITPVFATPEELARWCVENDNAKYGLAGPGARPDYEGWMRFIQVGWAPSMVLDSTGIRSGVLAASDL